MTNLIDSAVWALQHFEAMDRANAAIHCAPVRYSPITFHLAEGLRESWPDGQDYTEEVARVLGHVGAYEMDPGR